MKAIVFAVVFCTGVVCIAPAFSQSDTGFNYQGELKNNGDPVDGMREFEFRLWDAAVNGTVIGGAIFISDVELVDGLFNVELDFGAAAFNNDRRWLQIEVEGEVLSPRQEITRSPYSIQTRGIFVDDNERVGIGMTAPSSLLHVADGQSGASAVVDSLATLERGDHAYLSLLSPDNFERGIFFGGPSSNTSGGILYNNPAVQNGFQFRTNGGNVRAVISRLGKVGIGLTAPSSLLHVADGQSGASSVVDSMATLERGDHVYLSLLSPDEFERGIFFGGPSSNISGGILYNNPFLPNGFQFRTNGNQTRMVITDEGKVGVGTDDPINAMLMVVTNGSSSGAAYGVSGQTTSSEGGIGVFGSASSTIGQATGVYGVGSGLNGNGVTGTAVHQTGVNFAVRGESSSSSGYDFYAAGAGINYGATSSIRWKSNVVNIDHPLEKVAQLRGVYYDWDEEHGGQHAMGMIAEEVGKVLPEVVGYEENGVDAIGMDYSMLTPLLVEATNALQRENKQLRADVTRIQSENDLLQLRLERIERMMVLIVDK